MAKIFNLKNRFNNSKCWMTFIFEVSFSYKKNNKCITQIYIGDKMTKYKTKEIGDNVYAIVIKDMINDLLKEYKIIYPVNTEFNYMVNKLKEQGIKLTFIYKSKAEIVCEISFYNFEPLKISH